MLNERKRAAGSWPEAACCSSIRRNSSQALYLITMLRACGSVLQGCSTVNVSTMDTRLYQMRWQTWSEANVSVTASCWSAAHVQRASSGLLEATQQSSNTCHSQKIVLHSSSRMSKQPPGLKQYHKSNDFIYSFNIKMSSSSQSHPWGLWGRPTVS